MKKHHTEMQLLSRLSDLARRLQQVKAEATQLGIFTDDRELVECSKCGLKEDVDIHGFLLTCFDDSLGKDTGLRFKEVTGSEFQCPKCRSKVFARDLQDEKRVAKESGKAKRSIESKNANERIVSRINRMK